MKGAPGFRLFPNCLQSQNTQNCSLLFSLLISSTSWETSTMGASSEHAPPVSSPLSGCLTSPAMFFGSTSSTPNCCYWISLQEARETPDLTSSVKHSYRFTAKGMELIAEEGKILLGQRIHPNDVRLCHWSPSSFQPKT
ncbi:hypothetical protein PtA15_7A84 [Puccinia triticina]|uniref:Uncharacterized protein n=2 Tax=Puccinia triticina TaxID=208348 RepID=A0ABY7CN46_9BASI|nr:uncharacterized protein PtA15_7A84 [Puccinia triticina]WAQ86358.1 hypothetical protein PtA15_7A84 [Puccinia triticina]